MRSSRPIRESVAREMPSVSPKGKVRKSSEERKEKQKIESTLKNLLGSSEDISQLELVLSAIAYIRELQRQLEPDQENVLPEGFEQGFEQLFEKSVKA